MDSRQNNTLKELLKFSIANTSPDSTINQNNQLHELDEEKRNFLEKVVNKMSVDVIEDLAYAIGILEQEENSTNAEKYKALIVVRDYICNLDFANSFLNLGGSNILLKLAQHSDAEVRNCSMETIAEIAQNNAFAQAHFYEKKTIEILLNYLIHPREDTIASALYAISSLVRNNETAVKHLMNLGGLKMILECSQMHGQRVMAKSCFIIATLSSEYQFVGEEFIKLNTFTKLFRLLECTKEYNVKTECILRALYALSENSDSINYNASNVQCRATLQKIVEYNNSLPECEEIVEYCRKLLEKLPN